VRKLRVALIAILLSILILSTTSGRFLVLNDLEQADVIVVLAGETNRRPARGLQLLSQNYAPRMLLDVAVSDVVYDRSLIEIAKSYVAKAPQSSLIEICPVVGLSTKGETQDVARCLSHTGVRRILLVTSDYHTRRARSIFQHQLNGYQIFVTPAYDPQQFGASWWQQRQWAKINFNEWLRLMWWEAVDRWH
jgi:uncharacterized SAM-binding protein YcdF (DUF218 family)